MPPLYRMLEVCVYSLTNFLPFLAMALYPFRRRLRFSPAVAAALVGSADAAANGTGPVRCLLHAGAGQLSQRRQHGAVRRVLLSGGAGLSRQDAVYPADDL